MKKVTLGTKIDLSDKIVYSNGGMYHCPSILFDPICRSTELWIDYGEFQIGVAVRHVAPKALKNGTINFNFVPPWRSHGA